MLDELVGIVPKVCEYGKRLLEVDLRRGELDNVVRQVATRAEDLESQAAAEERNNPGKKRKKAVVEFLRQTRQHTESAQQVLDGCQQEERMLNRMSWVPSIERNHKDGHDFLARASKLLEEGLTFDEVRMRGEKLPLDEDQYMCRTVRQHREDAIRALRDDVNTLCVGIYGHAGAGKANLMKHLYNMVYDDRANFKAVFWAKAPETHNDQSSSDYHKALQKCVADGMWVDLDDGVIHDVVRGAQNITRKLQAIRSGKVVFFLDNVRGDFPAYELLGMPSVVTQDSTSPTVTDYDAASAVKCILVFTTLSRDVCNRMRCDLTLKMDLLEEDEAQEMFLHEVRRGYDEENERNLTDKQKKEIGEIAVKVAHQCARMPLAISVIANSMTRINALCEWRHRLNELLGIVSTINDDQKKILEQLKFGYDSLEESTVQHCFLHAATMLSDDREVAKADVIETWKEKGLIGTDRTSEQADHQGHTILNQLERKCLLQFASNNQSVTMNKWICKMAASVS